MAVLGNQCCLDIKIGLSPVLVTVTGSPYPVISIPLQGWIWSGNIRQATPKPLWHPFPSKCTFEHLVPLAGVLLPQHPYTPTCFPLHLPAASLHRWAKLRWITNYSLIKVMNVKSNCWLPTLCTYAHHFQAFNWKFKTLWFLLIIRPSLGTCEMIIIMKVKNKV